MAATISQSVEQHPADNTEHQIAELLDDTYGSGISCHPRLQSQYIFARAVDLGYIDSEGYLTRKGRSLMTRYQFQ